MATGTYGTSELDCYRRFGTAQTNADDPLDTAQARVIFNNLLHLNDQFLCPVCKWTAMVTSSGETRVAFTNTALGLVTTFFFPLRLDRDGLPYGLVCRVAGSNASSVTTAMYVHVHPAGEEPEEPNTAAGASGLSAQRAFTTSTDTWDSASGTDRLIYFDEPFQTELVTPFVTKNTTAGALPVSVSVAMFRADVWGNVNSASTAYLSGLEIRQYVGVNGQF